MPCMMGQACNQNRIFQTWQHMCLCKQRSDAEEHEWSLQTLVLTGPAAICCRLGSSWWLQLMDLSESGGTTHTEALSAWQPPGRYEILSYNSVECPEDISRASAAHSGESVQPDALACQMAASSIRLCVINIVCGNTERFRLQSSGHGKWLVFQARACRAIGMRVL